MKLYQLLVESRVDFLRDKYIPLLANKTYEHIKKKIGAKKDHSPQEKEAVIERYKKSSTEDFEKILIIDPTNNKIYLQWLLNNLLKFDFENYFKFIGEDLYKWKEYLTIYHKVKNRLPLDKKDINKLSFTVLKNIALKYKEKEQEIGTKNEVLDKKYKIAEDDEYLVYMFKNSSKEDFKYYQLVSTNTEWCTRPDYDTFKQYIEEDPLFVFINKNNRSQKYQFHEQSEQFMDETDNEIDNKLVIYFIKLIDRYLPEDFAMRMIIDNSWGFINNKGNIIAKGFNYVYSFSEGFARVQFQDNSWGFINNKGNITSKGFKSGWSFYEGFAVVKFQDNSWGYINKKGEVIAKGFKVAYSFSEGFARVQFQDDSWGYIDNKENIYEEDKKTLINKNDPRLKGIEINKKGFIQL